MKQTKPKFKVSKFYHFANLWKDGQTIETDILKVDQTDVLFKEIRDMIDGGEYIGIQINAKVRIGKSALAIMLAKYIFDYMKLKGQISEDTKFGTKNICANHFEYVLTMKDERTRFSVLVIDEEDATERKGHDSSAITAAETDFSNLHADSYVHTIRVSPKEIIDPNADIILTIMPPVDKKHMKTNGKIHYRYFEAGIEHIQLVGTFSISVKDVISNWINSGVQQTYYERELLRKQGLPTEKQDKILNDWEDKDYYIRYYMKKRFKLDLTTKYKVPRGRVLYYAPAILSVINRFKHLMGISNIKKNQIQNSINNAIERIGIPQSLVGQEIVSRSIEGVLNSYECLYNNKIEQKKISIKKTKGIITYEQWKNAYEAFEENNIRLKEDIKENEDKYKRMIKLMREYRDRYG